MAVVWAFVVDEETEERGRGRERERERDRDRDRERKTETEREKEREREDSLKIHSCIYIMPPELQVYIYTHVNTNLAINIKGQL